jgi:hypothetical protein
MQGKGDFEFLKFVPVNKCSSHTHMNNFIVILLVETSSSLVDVPTPLKIEVMSLSETLHYTPS